MLWRTEPWIATNTSSESQSRDIQSPWAVHRTGSWTETSADFGGWLRVALSGCGAFPVRGRLPGMGQLPSLFPLPALPFILLFKEVLKTADWAPVRDWCSFHWKPNKHLMCYFHSHSTRIGQSVPCLPYLKLVVHLHLHEEQLHQPLANEMRCFLWVCGSFATHCGSAFNEVSSFLEHSVWAVVQCGQQAAAGVQSVMLETSKIIKKGRLCP